MYEIELRALVDDFAAVRKKLDGIAQSLTSEEREATVFFYNPGADTFDMRLRLRKDEALLSFKEGIGKEMRKEVEMPIEDPFAAYEMLRGMGLEIRMIIARVKYTYRYSDFDILLNSVVDWGDAIEVEVTTADAKADVGRIKREIGLFMAEKLGLKELLTSERLQELNKEYRARADFEAITVQQLLDYVTGKFQWLTIVKEKVEE